MSAHAFVKPNEGVYSDDADDAGGETYKGYARRRNPLWLGWPIIDGYKCKYRGEAFLAALERDEALQRLILDSYKVNYWDRIWGDRIVDQGIATQMYDTAVNKGPKVSIRFAEMSVGMGATGVMSKTLLNRLNEMV